MRGTGRWAAVAAVMLVGTGAQAQPEAGATTDASDVRPPEVSTGAWAQRLFEEGSQAFTMGDYGLAIRKFEAAYAASQAVELLYNLGLAYARRHAVAPDVADLRRARALFANFADIRAANGEEVRDARERVVELDRQIAAIEAARAEALRAEAERAAAERAAEAARRAAEERRIAEARAQEQPARYRPRGLGVAGYATLGGGLLLGGGLATTGFVSLARLRAEHDGEAGLPLTGEREALYGRHEGEARTLGLIGVGVGAALVITGVALVVVDARRGRTQRRALAGAFGLQVRF